MASLYEITGEIAELLASFDDGEIPADLAERLNGLEDDLQSKLESCCKFLRDRETRAVAIQAELDRLIMARDAEKRKVEWMKKYMLACMESLGHTKVETPLFRLTVCKNGQPSVTLLGEAIPADYQRTKVELDKAKVIEDAKAGKALPEGIEVKQGTHLRIT